MERQITDTENRLVLLESLSLLGPVSDTQLLFFLTDLNLMNYFALHLNLSELCVQGQVESYRHPYGELYRITETGRYTLEQFTPIIPMSKRTSMRERAKEYKVRFRNEQLMPAGETTLPGGALCVRLQLLEKELLLLDIHLKVARHYTCLEERWHGSASLIYAFISETLAKGFRPEQTADDLSVLPPGTSLTHAEGEEWTLYLSDRPEDPTFTLILSIADRQLAQHYAHTWPDMKEMLHEAVEALLSNGLQPASGR
ncbi:MAG: DUF4364 family protein [Clostridia bacterium]|nr:DUF4364 family protein [Clostridia bacterium]